MYEVRSSPPLPRSEIVEVSAHSQCQKRLSRRNSLLLLFSNKFHALVYYTILTFTLDKLKYV
jgi:hypothetical protein